MNDKNHETVVRSSGNVFAGCPILSRSSRKHGRLIIPRCLHYLELADLHGHSGKRAVIFSSSPHGFHEILESAHVPVGAPFHLRNGRLIHSRIFARRT
jgi:hypothetical protein